MSSCYKKNPLVSIITVTKNSELFIEETIRSVINQNYINIEYIIIDGKSQDRTIPIIRKYSDRISYWVSEPDKSMYEAINKGLKVCNGDIIAILNSDDCYVDYDVVTNVVQEFSKSNISGLYGDTIMDYGTYKMYRKVFQITFKNLLRSCMGTYVPHPTLFLKKEFIEVVGFYDTKYRYASDYDFILRCLEKLKVKYIHLPITKFRRHESSISSSNKINPEKIEIIKSHCSRIGIKKILIFKYYFRLKFLLVNIFHRLF